MKTVLANALSSVLFLSLVSAAACGGDRNLPTPTAEPTSGTFPVAVSPPRDPVDARVAPPVVAPAALSAPDPLAVPTTYADALALGKSLIAKGDARAKEMLALAVKLDRTQAAPHVELARIAISANERATAIKEAQKAVKLAPRWSQAHNTLGRAELLRHAYERAIVAFETATELEPENAWAWNNLGYTQLQRAQYEDALASLVQATSKPGAAGYMFNNLGTAYEHLDQLDDARDAFARGGALGSVEARASRQRLEGVDSIIVLHTVAPPVTPATKEYETREEMPEPMAPEPAAVDESLALPVTEAPPTTI